MIHFKKPEFFLPILYLFSRRGHTVKAVCESFTMSKDAGFKVVSHMMPDLPNVDFERDVEQFIEFFENPAFRADGMFTINYLLTPTERVLPIVAVDKWVEL